MQDNISLDQIMGNDHYDFMQFYKNTEDTLDENDLPIHEFNHNCEYYEPDQFCKIRKNSEVAMPSTLFHINARS